MAAVVFCSGSLVMSDCYSDHNFDMVTNLRRCIVGWWIFWLMLASLLYGGLSYKVILLVLFSVLGFYLGTLPLSKISIQNRALQNEVSSSIKLPVYGLTAIIGYQLILYRKSSLIIEDLGAGFREAYFESGVHGSSESFVLYEQFLIPIGIYLVAVWMCRRSHGGWWFLYVAAFFLLDAVIKAGRFPLYYLVFFLLVAQLLGTIRLKLSHIIPMLIGLPVLSVYQLLSRRSFLGEVNADLIKTIFEEAVLKYHVGGFYLLESLMQNPVLQTPYIFPSYTLGYFQYILSLYLRRFGISIEYTQQALNTAMSDVTYIDNFGYFNAFATNILPFYLDGGFIFSFTMFCLLGYLLRTGVGAGFQKLYPINVIAAFVMIFGIFQPIAITGYFFIPLLIHIMTPLLDSLHTRLTSETK
ncbi:MAG: hypothetical protein NDI77_00600 [Geobacteraceae bacterium]|nr:hypothetical protein [Geobacteraceae bacterium]